MEPKQFLSIVHLCEGLKNIPRHSDTSTGRRESVAEHSWRIALMAFLLRDEYPDLDMDKVTAMCLIHDLGEIFTGDKPAFLKTDEDTALEQQLYHAWIAQLPPKLSEAMQALLAEMEARQSPEAKLYKALDRIEAVIQHNEAPITSWLPLEYELQKTYGTAECDFDPYLRALRAAVLAETLEKIQQEPPSK